jgi:tetratricopeptide (TPR) repeat protein
MAPARPDLRLDRAKVLVQIGWLHDAELEVAELLDQRPDDFAALNLYAKIKHIRGELSQAIACWAQIHARSPHTQSMLVRLQAMMHLAEDPERGAGEFLALEGPQMARKPAAQLALERAFALFRARRADEARALCGELARKHRGSDPDLYKMSTLAHAWLSELAGDLDAAGELLQDLGKERGFETDRDRLLALVGVYERIGTPETLASAVKICRHLERDFARQGVEMVSLLSRTAVLHRRLGRAPSAVAYEQAFLHAVRRRMHRPTLAEVARVAACYYLPLARLRGIRLYERDAPAGPSRRERALVAALEDDLVAARAALADGGDALDRAYLADLAALEGDDAAAARLYLTVIAETDEARTWERIDGWLLDYHARSADRAVTDHLARPEVSARLRAQLEAAIQLAPLEAVHWDRLATCHALAGDPDQADRCRDRALALSAAQREARSPIGRVLSAGVYHFIGKAKGLIHEVSVYREPTGAGRGGTLPTANILGNLTPEMRAAVRNTFYAVREYARTKFPARTADLFDYDYSFKLPKEDEPSGGLSAGVPAALAFLSTFLQRPVPQTLASTGRLITDAHDVLTVGPVGEVEYKIKAVYHRDLEALLLPLGNRAALERSPVVPRALVDEVARYIASFDDAVKLVFGPDVFVHA